MKQVIKLLLVAIIVCSSGCKKTTGEPPAPASRSFYMGTTPWPADFTFEEVDAAYSFINNHCDIVSHHFDEGIPYEEAYNSSNWPARLMQDINTRKTKIAPGKKIFLSSSALSITRKQKATYYSHMDTIAPAIKNYWEQLPVNNEKIVTAYTNFISLLIDSFQPAFINYGVESNVDSWDSAAFAEYKDFLRQVYGRLKLKYPGTPLMVSFIVNESSESFDFAKQLMPYTDYVALSAYPYTHISSSVGGNTDPALFPANYFNRFINLDSNKPLCFAETGYIAEPLVVPSFNLNQQGTPAWQQAYLEKVCGLLQERNGKFLIWFCNKDYDAGNQRLKATGQYFDLLALWQNTGLISETNALRPAYNSWLSWMQKPKQ